MRVIENISELFGIQGMEIERIVEEDDLSVTLHLGRSEGVEWSCPSCHSLNVICYDHAPARQIRDLPIWDRVCRLAFRPARVKCRSCGAVSTERLSWMEANQHQTLRFERRLVLLCEKMTAKEASEFERIDRDAVYRIERRWLERAESKWEQPPVSKLGIDEIAIRKGHNYATVFYDLEKAEVVGMVEGRKAADCSKFLKGWGKERRNAASEGLNNKIKVIKRRSYGFRDFEYFRLKVLQCAGSLPSVANAYPL